MMKFIIRDSGHDTVEVGVELSPLALSCSCKAAEFGLPCRHRIAILSGENPGIVEGDVSRLPEIKRNAEKTEVFALLQAYEQAKERKKARNKEADNAFKGYKEAFAKVALGKVKTNRGLEKATEAMNAAVGECVKADEEAKAVLNRLRDVFVWGNGE
jgi:flagellar biosynthesis/type III secretory pathway protein FliH